MYYHIPLYFGKEFGFVTFEVGLDLAFEETAGELLVVLTTLAAISELIYVWFSLVDTIDVRI